MSECEKFMNGPLGWYILLSKDRLYCSVGEDRHSAQTVLARATDIVMQVRVRAH
jgi:isoleucyl-tRNA synthetase